MGGVRAKGRRGSGERGCGRRDGADHGNGGAGEGTGRSGCGLRAKGRRGSRERRCGRGDEGGTEVAGVLPVRRWVGAGGAGAVDPLTAPEPRRRARRDGHPVPDAGRVPAAGVAVPAAGLPLRCTGSRTVADRPGTRGRAAPAGVGDIGNPAPAPAYRQRDHAAPLGTGCRAGDPGERRPPRWPTPRSQAPAPAYRTRTARRPHRTPRGDPSERHPPTQVAGTGEPSAGTPRPAGHPASVPGSGVGTVRPRPGRGHRAAVAGVAPGRAASGCRAGSVGGRPRVGVAARVSTGGPPVGPCPSWTGGCAPRPGVSRRRAPRPCAGPAPRAAVRAAGRRAGR
ncbi:hypothetical protein SUDANB151_01583 [Streptomyces sp. enrichment culture]